MSVACKLRKTLDAALRDLPFPSTLSELWIAAGVRKALSGVFLLSLSLKGLNDPLREQSFLVPLILVLSSVLYSHKVR